MTSQSSCSSPTLPRTGHRQRGVATLLVVMVLFFIVSMVAAYTSRNLIFEQRTSANQYRSTQALEAADAGLQWALSMLNGGRIDANCQPTTNLASTSFRQRYLTIQYTSDDPSGKFQANVAPTGGGTLMPSCVFDPDPNHPPNWACSCPADGPPAMPASTVDGVLPAFRIRFNTFAARPGMVQIQVNGCTRAADSCLNFPAQGVDSDARVTVSALLALKGAINTVPAAPLTARGSIDLGGAALTAVNSSPTATGLTVNAGGAVAMTGLTLVTTPGSPPTQSVAASDLSLSLLSADRMFANTFGIWRGLYREQPGAVKLNCALGGCSAAVVRTAGEQYPGRVIWVQGDLNVDSTGDIGSADEPLALVVSGNVQFSAAATIYGLIYTQAAVLNSSGSAQVRGALVAEGNVAGNSTATLIYDADILQRLRLRTGSLVVVPGSWKDFQ